EAGRAEFSLPSNACLLTFDDGFIDHYTVVFPRLLARGLSGSFYPPAMVARGGRVLDVHKIHFILAACTDHEALAARLLELIDARRFEAPLPGVEALKSEHWSASPVGDPAPTAFIKRVLQKRPLSPEIRSAIAQALFEEWIGIDEAVFARELYMDVTQLRAMAASGMEIGGH